MLQFTKQLTSFFSVSGDVLKHRRVKHYGYKFYYDVNNIDPTRPLADGIPAECRLFLDRLTARGLIKTKPDQLTVNQYLPGQGNHSFVSLRRRWYAYQ